MSKPSTTAQAIRQLRIKLACTKAVMAGLLDLSLSGYANYEAGLRLPGPDTLEALAALARENKLRDLASVFDKELDQKIQESTGPITKEERAWTLAVLFLIRNGLLGSEIKKPMLDLLDQLRREGGDNMTMTIGEQSIDQVVLDLRVLGCQSAEEKLNALTAAYMEKNPLVTEAKAAATIIQENPGLAAQLQRESTIHRNGGKR